MKVMTSIKSEKFGRVLIAMLAMSAVASVMATSVFAAGTATADPTVISGGMSLVTKIFTWLNPAIVLTSGGIFGYHAWMKSIAEEGSEVASRNKAMKRVVIWGPIALTGNAIMTFVFAYLS